MNLKVNLSESSCFVNFLSILWALDPAVLVLVYDKDNIWWWDGDEGRQLGGGG